ncbi:unnamed protein product [Closterium sp. NIES-65]|nr:unnamed protein product [Closterium sp. NIES-65]
MPPLSTRSSLLFVFGSIAQVLLAILSLSTAEAAAATAAAAHSFGPIEGHGVASAAASGLSVSASAVGLDQRRRGSGSSASLQQESPAKRTLKSAEGGVRGTCAQCREQLKELQEWFAGVEASKLGDAGSEGQPGGGGGRGRGGGGRGGAGGRGREADDVMELQSRLGKTGTEEGHRGRGDVMELQSRLVEKQGELKQLKAEYEALQVGLWGSARKVTGEGGREGRDTEAGDVMVLQSRLVEKQGELKRLKAEYESLHCRGTEVNDVMELQIRLVEKQGELKRLKAEYESLHCRQGSAGLDVKRSESTFEAPQNDFRKRHEKKRHQKVNADKAALDVKLTESCLMCLSFHPSVFLPTLSHLSQHQKRHQKVNADKAALDVKLTESCLMCLSFHPSVFLPTLSHLSQHQKRHQKVNADKAALDVKLTESGADWGKKAITKEALTRATELLHSCKPQTGPVISKKVPSWKGYSCSATERELQRYMDFETRGMCPDDWLFVQDLIFRKQCHSLPKRPCLARTAHKIVEPLSRPASLFAQSALQDSSVRWNNHAFSSFASLNALSPSALATATAGTGDACGRQPGGGGCWNMSAEERRWMVKPPKNTAAGGALTVKEVIAIKKGALRIGLDFNGGSGSFAAHMARHNVTMMTSAMNLEANVGRKKGLPFLETIALRGLVPIWLPYKVRLPFYDNTLDILHATNAIKFMPSPAEFEEVLFEWDRVLRVGGVMWFEEFTASAAEMPSYLSVLDLLKYRHLHWSLTPPKAMIGKPAGTVILHCLLEKPMRKDL